MSDRTDSTKMTQAGSWTDVLPCASHSVDVLIDAQSAQSAWGDEQRAPALPVARQSTPGTSRPPSDSSSSASSLSDTPPTESIEVDKYEDFGDFVSAPTDPFKQPIYTQHEVYSSENLLNADSKTEQQIGIFEGIGLVEPMRATLDTSTRGLRRAGKLALRKLQIMQENKATEGQLRHQLRRDSVRDSNVSIKTPDDVEDIVDGPGAEQVAQENQYAETPAPVPASPSPLNGVMRPVSFARPMFTPEQRKQLAEINKMMDAELMVWNGLNVWGDMP